MDMKIFNQLKDTMERETPEAVGRFYFGALQQKSHQLEIALRCLHRPTLYGCTCWTCSAIPAAHAPNE